MNTVKELVDGFNTDDTIALTQTMIQIKSIDPPGNEAGMSEFVEKYLQDARIDQVEALSVEGLAPEPNAWCEGNDQLPSAPRCQRNNCM